MNIKEKKELVALIDRDKKAGLSPRDACQAHDKSLAWYYNARSLLKKQGIKTPIIKKNKQSPKLVSIPVSEPKITPELQLIREQANMINRLIGILNG